MMKMTGNRLITAATRMSDAVSGNPFMLLLLEHMGIDLPLQEKTVGELAADYGLTKGLFITFIHLYGDADHSVGTLSDDEVPGIIRYLRNSHRYYTEDVYPGIMESIRRISGEGSSEEAILIEKFFGDYLEEVKNHFEYEEDTVFPYIDQLLGRISSEVTAGETGGYSVAEYKEHHDDIEEKLDDLKNLLIEYLPLKEGRNMRRRLLFKLYELEHDLRIHSRIEDYILIPLVTSMEKRLKENR